MRASEKTRRLTGLALMTAIIVVLQVVASFVKFGPFTITLALAPILIGAALYGPKAGACLGGVFGAVVLLACILGWDPGGAILWNANPFLTALVCLGKGILAGLAAGLVYRAIAWGGKSHSSGRMLGGSIAAGIVSPVVNTGLFLLGLFFLFPTYLEAWATGAGQTVITYMIFTMVSINFVLELLINLVLSTDFKVQGSDFSERAVQDCIGRTGLHHHGYRRHVQADEGRRCGCDRLRSGGARLQHP